MLHKPLKWLGPGSDRLNKGTFRGGGDPRDGVTGIGLQTGFLRVCKQDFFVILVVQITVSIQAVSLKPSF